MVEPRRVKIIVSRESLLQVKRERESDLSVVVVPTRIVVQQGEEVTWELESRLPENDPCARDRDPRFRVSPKQPDWPFRSHPHRGDRRTPADSGRMSENAAGSYKYGVTVTCPGEVVEVDPDMDVME